MRFFTFKVLVSILFYGMIAQHSFAQNKTLVYYNTHEDELLPDAKTAFQNADYERTVELCRWYYIFVGDAEADGLNKDATQCQALSRDMKEFKNSGLMDAAREKARLLFALNGNDHEAAEILASGPSSGVVNGNEWVNMGLSVKWATHNMGATTPSGIGNYYAWGETSLKASFTWENYAFRISGDSDDTVVLNKYIRFGPDSPYKHNEAYDTNRELTDNKEQLDFSDDVAVRNWGGGWRMPTCREMRELTMYCTWTWSVQNGVSGFTVTSKTTGNSIFLPAYYEKDQGYYWTSSLNKMNSNGALCLVFDSKGVKDMAGFFFGVLRRSGLCIRPVIE